MCVFDRCRVRVLLWAVPWQRKWLYMPRMRRHSGEGAIADRNPNQIGILEAPGDNPAIPGLLGGARVSSENSWDSWRVLPVYKVVTFFLAK